MQIYYLMLYFFVYGFLGWCTEVAYATTKQRKFVNRGFLNGPICPIYGVGVTVVVYFLTPYKDKSAAEYRWICLPDIFPCVGSSMCTDRPCDSSGHS